MAENLNHGHVYRLVHLAPATMSNSSVLRRSNLSLQRCVTGQKRMEPREKRESPANKSSYEKARVL